MPLLSYSEFFNCGADSKTGLNSSGHAIYHQLLREGDDVRAMVEQLRGWAQDSDRIAVAETIVFNRGKILAQLP